MRNISMEFSKLAALHVTQDPGSSSHSDLLILGEQPAFWMQYFI